LLFFLYKTKTFEEACLSMEPLASRYWRDADLTGLQLTANMLLHHEIRPHRHVGFTLSVSNTELHVRTCNRVTVVPPGAMLRIAPQVWHSVQACGVPWREDAMYCSSAVARCISAAHESTGLARVEDDAGISVFIGFCTNPRARAWEMKKTTQWGAPCCANAWPGGFRCARRPHAL
jgi:hypothetical protein